MLGAYHNQTGPGRVLARDACQGRQPVPSADSLVWWEHADGDQALGRLEVHVTGKGAGYAGVDDEPDTRGVDVCCLADPRAWHSEGGTALGTLLPLLSVMVVLNLVYVGSLLAAVFSSARNDVVSHLGLVVATYPY